MRTYLSFGVGGRTGSPNWMPGELREVGTRGPGNLGGRRSEDFLKPGPTPEGLTLPLPLPLPLPQGQLPFPQSLCYFPSTQRLATRLSPQ